MRQLVGTTAALVLSALSFGPVHAEPAVVVELFTSQGCSSCPPADAFFSEIVGREDVIALALHVDYWDYIGWKDTFGSHDFTLRQYGYASAAGTRTVYTPQFVIGGAEHVVGNNPSDVANAIRQQQAKTSGVTVTLNRKGNGVGITATATSALPQGTSVQIIRYTPEADVAIKRGENAGRTITYHNIVTGIESLGAWDGSSPFTANADIGAGKIVAIVQSADMGPILAAAQLR